VTTVERGLPTAEARDLLGLVRQVAAERLAPAVDAAEARAEFPRDLLGELGGLGLLGLPYPADHGGGGQPYEVYLQVVEELSAVWAAVALSVSVHVLSCFPIATFGTDAQREQWLPGLLDGSVLGAYCLSEPHSGSDAAALSTKAVADAGRYRLSGTKAWITHGGVADFYTVMARTGGPGARGISCFHVEAASPGLSAAPPERKMGYRSSLTAQVLLDDVAVDADRRVGAEGQGFAIALAALDCGRLGIAACAVGLAQAALDAAVAYAAQRRQFGARILDHQGTAFCLADAATGVEAARALYLTAARRKDAGQPFARQAAMAKLFATDVAMRVTTDAVQVLGGAGCTTDHPAERYFREAKVLQIVEGTNQVQRLVISRYLDPDRRR